MKTIQEIAYLAIAVYREYRDSGLSVEEAEQKAVRETVEANVDVELINIHARASGLRMFKTREERQRDQ